MKLKASIHMLVQTVLMGCLILLIMVGCASPQHEGKALRSKFIYDEFDQINLYYKTKDIQTYRELLPDVFEMPDEPMVKVFFADYYKMDDTTEPYQEAAIFLLAKYKGKNAWHCLTMPVTSEAARFGGVTYLGYPKILANITIERNVPKYKGELNLNGKTVMVMAHEVQDRAITAEEEQYFKDLTAIPSLNILNGEVYEPKIGGNQNALEVSRSYPDKFIVKVGKAALTVDRKAAGNYSERMAKIYSIAPSENVLAYYLQCKFTLWFQR